MSGRRTYLVLAAVGLAVPYVVFVRFLRLEAARFSIPRSWIQVVTLCAAGLSLALPLFLYARESRLEQGRETESATTGR